MKNRSIELYGDGIGSVDYVQHMGNDLTVVNSARVSFGVEKEELDKRDYKLINYLVSHKHTSTLEHNLITFRFTVPLFIRSQHHRHRTWSYNEISRRYTEENIRFYEPLKFRTQHKSNRQASNDELINPNFGGDTNVLVPHSNTAADAVASHHINCVSLYERLMEAGVCREQARGVLPQNMYTEYYGTANLNNIFKFVGLRLHDGAQWEIQKVAEACLKIAKELYPITTEAYINNISDDSLKSILLE